ncbi:MAG: hemolysin III family protein [Rhodovibrionaceae bacterium]|nr:hemolysin III family protein [Rhodovibrionaceae bacterium]
MTNLYDDTLAGVAFPEYARSEVIADAVIHVLGAAFAVVSCIALGFVAAASGEALVWLALSVYGAGLVAMLGFSALYNLVTDAQRKVVYRRLDHAAIFAMIAGTYTPFSLIAMGGPWGYGLLAFVWTVAAAGILLKLFHPQKLERFSVIAYLLLGWSVVVALEHLTAAVSWPGLILLGAGGALYTLGVVFHLWHRLPYQNAIWHAFVLAAAACHFAAVIHEIAALA